MPVVIDRLGLMKIKTNAELKKRFGIVSAGYPTIYMPKELTD